MSVDVDTSHHYSIRLYAKRYLLITDLAAMTNMTGGAAVVEGLRQEGVSQVFGMIGTALPPIPPRTVRP